MIHKHPNVRVIIVFGILVAPLRDISRFPALLAPWLSTIARPMGRDLLHWCAFAMASEDESGKGDSEV